MVIGDKELIEMVLIHLDLPGRIVKIFNEETSLHKIQHQRGYLRIISASIQNSLIAESILTNNLVWNKYIKESFSPSEYSQSTPTVQTNRKSITYNSGLKDSIEDKIET